MLNKVILKGHIGRPPQFSKTQTGADVGKFFLATSTSWKEEDGEWKTHTEWHRITVFKTSTLKWMKGILKQGDTIYLEGKLSYHCWKDKFEQDRVTPHVMITNREGIIELIRSSPSSATATPLPSLPHDEKDKKQASEEDEDIPLSQPLTENSL